MTLEVQFQVSPWIQKYLVSVCHEKLRKNIRNNTKLHLTTTKIRFTQNKISQLSLSLFLQLTKNFPKTHQIILVLRNA
jgi:macrodomain Ter protein organizer (MatP/YcbG family)